MIAECVKHGRTSPCIKHNFKHNLNTMKQKLNLDHCQIIDVINDKINNTKRQIDKEIAGIESAIQTKFYCIAHSKIDEIEKLNNDLKDLHNYLIDANESGISRIKTFKDFNWSNENFLWNGILEVYDPNKSKKLTVSLSAGEIAYSEPREFLDNVNDYLEFEVCVWDDKKEIQTDYYYNWENDVIGYKNVKFINNLLTKIQIK